jgi:hypothetical protein
MIKKYTYIIIGMALMFFSCSVKRDIPGKYMSKNNPNFVQFRSDHTFIYEYRALHLYEQSIGKWQTTGKNLIILNSDIKSTIIPIKVSNNLNRANENNIVSIDLNIKGVHALEDYKCQICINDTNYCIKRCDSLTSIPIRSPIHSIFFKFVREPQAVTTTAISLPLVTDKYFTEAKTGNNLTVKIDFSDTYFYYKAFNNDTLKVKGNAIKMFNSYKGKWEKILKVSDATNLFSRYNDKSTELNIFR